MPDTKDLSDRTRLEEDTAREAGIDFRARLILAEIYGIPPRPDGKPPVFDLSNIDLGRVYTRKKAAPECYS